MNQKKSLIRPLSSIENAFTISNDIFPLCVVCVLHLSPKPSIEKVKLSLLALQKRHPLLRAGISKINGKLSFYKIDPVLEIEFETPDKIDENSWQSITEKALNTIFDKSGPLMKCWYLQNGNNENAELIVCFHHSIIDGISARLILHELLSLIGDTPLPEAFKNESISVFPPNFQKWKLKKRLFAFSFKQMHEEFKHRKNGITSPIPLHSTNGILSFKLPLDVSRKLSIRIGREGLSLNTVLLAAISEVLLKHKFVVKDGNIVRLISFADTRSGMNPPVSDQEMGCYVSMLRLPVHLKQNQSLIEFAKSIRKAIFKSSRNGEVFLMSILSKFLVKMVMKMRNMRLGVSALSFIGVLKLEPQYGEINLLDVKAFISNNQLGPEFSAFGKILFGCIGLDFTYLTAEISKEKAKQMALEIKEFLIKIANEH